MRPARAALFAVLSLAVLATHAPVLRAQQSAPVAVTTPADSTAPARRVREFPVVFGGALVGGGLGFLAGAGAGALLGSGTDDTGDEFFPAELVGAVAGGIVGYTIGAGVGAHLAASSRPRPNALATIGISVLSAAAVGVAGGALGSGGVTEATAAVLAVAVPVAHLALTSQFARWRAQRERARPSVAVVRFTPPSPATPASLPPPAR
jgi:hypothetical protein